MFSDSFHVGVVGKSSAQTARQGFVRIVKEAENEPQLSKALSKELLV